MGWAVDLRGCRICSGFCGLLASWGVFFVEGGLYHMRIRFNDSSYASDDFELRHDLVNVDNIIEILKRLNEKGSAIYFYGEERDYKFNFYGGNSPEKVDKLEQDLGYSLPDDYRRFLLITDGMDFNLSGFSSRLFDISWVVKARAVDGEFNLYSDNFLVIGDCHEGNFKILIDLTCESEKNIFVADSYDSEYFYGLGISFATFLNRFVLTFGSAFWEWGILCLDE